MNEQLYPLGCVLEGHARCLPYELRSLMRVAYLWPSATEHALCLLCAAHTKHSRCSLMRCAYRHPWRVWLSSLRASNFFSTAKRSHQDKMVGNHFEHPKDDPKGKVQDVLCKGRPPASHLSLRVSSNTGRENAFPTRLSLRLLPAIWPALAFDARGDLSRWIKQSKAKQSKRFAYLWAQKNTRYLRLFRITARSRKFSVFPKGKSIKMEKI